MTQACADCHDDVVEAFRRNAHATTPNDAGPAACAACHGPTQAHLDGDAEQIRRFGRLKAEEASQVCLTCHDRGRHASYIGSTHEGRSVGCTTCHAIHASKSPAASLRARTEAELCTSCHRNRQAPLVHSSRMPLAEGRMSCSSCHDPHGGIGPSSLNQVSVNENCYACHAEKRAPRLWEHPPVKESCALCHDPHGSAHPNLLRVKMPRLCQECHDEVGLRTSPLHSTQGGRFSPPLRLFSRSCMQCHVDIHGSNHPSGSKFQR